MRSSQLTHEGPSTSWLLYWIGRLWLRLFGWEVVGEVPAGVKKAVVIAAPHTTNWDLVFMLATTYVFRLDMSFLAKHTLFTPPLGWLLRWLGGIPIDRTSPRGAVGQVADAIERADRIAIAVPPSGTRKKRDHWKSGFYWIAHTAQVPVLCGFLDFKNKRSGLGYHFIPTGDVKADMDKVREFYKDIQGKYPENQSTILLREEEGEAADS